MLTTLALALLLGPHIEAPPQVEIAAWAILRQVPVALALAVADQETGHVPETSHARALPGFRPGAPDPVRDPGRAALGRWKGATRDTVISGGNYGRFQVACATWLRPFGLKTCRDLLPRHRNIAVGVTILARCYAVSPGFAAALYNDGPQGRWTVKGLRYQSAVAAKMRRLTRAGEGW